MAENEEIENTEEKDVGIENQFLKILMLNSP